MRIHLVLLLFCILISSRLTAQIEKSQTRMEGSFKLESFKDGTNADFSMVIGHLVSNSLELGGILGITKREDFDTFGRIGGNAIYHVLPGKTVSPGVGTSLSHTFGYPKRLTHDLDSMIWDVYLNLDAFLSPQCALNIRAGYERWDGDWGSSNGFSTQLGFAVFVGPKK